MGTINNFNLINSLLEFESEDTFYFLQCIIRRKDNNDIGPDNKVIKDYYIDKYKDLNYYKEEIIGICDYFNARAYIHLNSRSYKDVSFECLSILADRLQKGEYKSNRGIWSTACGRKHSDSNKKWIVDIDFVPSDCEDNGLKILDVLYTIKWCQPDGDKFIEQIPTKNGVHLITHPFNKKEFKDIYPCIDIHTNNPTLLYC